MFYEDVGIVPAAVVFTVIIILYRSVTWLTGKSKAFEEFIEGKTECLIQDGKFSISSFKKETLAQDEFFSELRIRSIEHLGFTQPTPIQQEAVPAVMVGKDLIVSSKTGSGKTLAYLLPMMQRLLKSKPS